MAVALPRLRRRRRRLGGFEYAQGRAAHAATTAELPETPAALKVKPEAALPEFDNVAGVSSIVRQPNSEMIDVSYNQLVPRQVEGSLDNPAIRQLLMLASQNAASPAIRDDAVWRCLPPSARPAIVASPRVSARR